MPAGFPAASMMNQRSVRLPAQMPLYHGPVELNRDNLRVPEHKPAALFHPPNVQEIDVRLGNIAEPDDSIADVRDVPC